MAENIKLWIFKTVAYGSIGILFSVAGWQIKEILAKDKSQDKKIMQTQIQIATFNSDVRYIIKSQEEMKEAFKELAKEIRKQT